MKSDINVPIYKKISEYLIRILSHVKSHRKGHKQSNKQLERDQIRSVLEILNKGETDMALFRLRYWMEHNTK